MQNTNYSTKVKTIKIKRLYHGLASVRDYVLNDIIQRKLDLILQCGKDKMFIPNSMIYHKGKNSDQVCTSKFNGKSYSLIDFNFKSNQSYPNQTSLFPNEINYGQ